VTEEAPPAQSSLASLDALRHEIEQLRREKTDLEAVLEGATDAIFSMDLEGKLLTFNAELARRVKESSGLTITTGAPLFELFAGYRQAWQAQVTRAFAGEAVQFDVTIPSGEKEEQFRVSLRPITSDGQVRAVAVFSRNVTEQTRNARALAEMDRLAAVGTVAAGVAHEIANPLTFVLSHLDAALSLLTKLPAAEREPLPRVRSLLTDARYGAHRIHDVVKDLRSFSRPEDPVHRPIALAHVVDRALTMAQGEIRGRARIEKRHEEGVSRVLGSEGRLSQVALNLLVNAAQALPEDGADHVITSVIRSEGRDVVFEVLDTGVGVSREALEHAFEPFFTTKAKGAGTGLGLAISKQIVIAHHGELLLQNRPGGGAIARVRLPAYDSPT
jgi:signal transduction histidine kinase